MCSLEMKQIRPTSKQFQKLCDRRFNTKKRLQNKVRTILEDVRSQGDKAVIRYTNQFDKVKLTRKQLKVTEAEISGAFQNINSDFANQLKLIIKNVNAFYRKRIYKDLKIKLREGLRLGEFYTPLERVGVYIPAGTAPLVSSVYMTVLPAKIAGVKEIIMVSPPNQYKTINSHILVIANLLKVKHIYKIGGAQAIGALAFGTQTVPRVDKIIGPGNEYVTEAKRQVYGFVDIDMVAGPSEVVIIANQYTNVDYLIKDLKAQAEHYKGLSILITTSKKQARYVKDKIKQGFLIVARNLKDAAELANQLAPEHLQIMIKSPSRLLRKIKNAGAVFTGQYSPVAAGDYFAGPSHVLPTGGTAKFFSALGIEDFLKRTHFISFSKKALEEYQKPLENIATIEGLKEHLQSVKVRLEDRKA